MRDTPERNCQSIPDMIEEVKTVSGKRFHVIVAGKTGGAHQEIVDKLRASNHSQVPSHDEYDYLLVFCPTTTRVGTDISEALENIEGGKPIILVVMHHTFNRDHVVADSRRQVTNSNVVLTVDYLFHEDKLLNCHHNDISWYDITKALGISPLKHDNVCNRLDKQQILVVVFVLLLIMLVLVILMVEYI